VGAVALAQLCARLELRATKRADPGAAAVFGPVPAAELAAEIERTVQATATALEHALAVLSPPDDPPGSPGSAAPGPPGRSHAAGGGGPAPA
jgi:hypothetical protein